MMAAAALADGVTTIESAACEPEVADYGQLLNAMGAKIEGLGTPFLQIEGVESLAGAEHHVIPDRIEAATLLIAGAITHGEVSVENVCIDHLSAVLDKLKDVGVRIGITEDPGSSDRSTLHVLPSGKLTSTECSGVTVSGPADRRAGSIYGVAQPSGWNQCGDRQSLPRSIHACCRTRSARREYSP